MTWTSQSYGKADTKHHPTECVCCDFKICIGIQGNPEVSEVLNDYLPSSDLNTPVFFSSNTHNTYTITNTPSPNTTYFSSLKSHFLPREIRCGSFNMYLLSEMTLFSENQMSLPAQSLVGKLPFSNRGSHFICHF